MRSMITLAVLMFTASAFAKGNDLKPKCASVAQEKAVAANQKTFGAETSGCGTKLLHLGDQLETYLVCVSDETDPSEWIVVVKRDVVNKKSSKIIGSCDVEYTGYAVDAATPDFD